MAVICRRCHSKLSDVTNTYRKEITWRGKKIIVIRRRRRCIHCGYCWFTVERYEDENLELREDPIEVPKEDKPKRRRKKKGTTKSPENPFLDNAPDTG